MVYQTEKVNTESGSKLAPADLESVKTMVADAKKVLDNKTASMPELKEAFEKLQASSHKITEELYKATSANGGAGAQSGADAGSTSAGDAGTPPGGKKAGGDDVIDADFKDVN